MISLLFLHTWTPQASLLVTSTAGQRGAYGRWDVWNCHGESVDVPECLAMCGHTLYLAQPLFRSVPSLASGFDVGGALGRPDKPNPPRPETRQQERGHTQPQHGQGKECRLRDHAMVPGWLSDSNGLPRRKRTVIPSF